MTLTIVPLLLAGCTTTSRTDVPSLAPRPIEARGEAEPTVVPQAPATDPELDAEIAKRATAFQSAARAFDAARPAVAAKVAHGRGAAEGSDRWIDAQSAIGDLQQLRTAGDGAMAELEALAIERAQAGAPPYPALDAAIAAAQVELDRQAAAEAAVKGGLGG